jgi:hypothetical protein
MAKLGYTFYPKDWASSESVFELNLSERGLYRELIDLAMMNDNITEIKIEVWSRKFAVSIEDLEAILNKLISLNLIEINGQTLFIPSCESRLNMVRGGSVGGKKSKGSVKGISKGSSKGISKGSVKQIEREIEREEEIKENIIPMSGKPDGDVAQTSKDSEITTITEKWITYINSIFAKKYTSASWSKKIEGNIKKLLKAYGDKSKLSDNFKIVTKNILQDTFHIENNYRYVTPEYVSRLAVFDRFLNIEASQNNGRWRHPSDIVMCSDWIKKIPQPPNPLDVEACEQFCTDWKIAQLRTYQYEKTGCTNMIHDYEP